MMDFGKMFGMGDNPVTGQEKADISDEAKKLLDEQNKRSNRSSEDIVKDQIGGTEKAAELMNTQNNQPTSLAMAGGDDVQKALSKRANKSFEESQIYKTNKAKMNVAGIQMKNTANATQNLLKKQNINAQAQQIEMQNRQARQGWRNQMIGTIFNTAGMIAGAAMGKPPSKGPVAENSGANMSNVTGGGNNSAGGSYGGGSNIA